MLYNYSLSSNLRGRGLHFAKYLICLLAIVLFAMAAPQAGWAATAELSGDVVDDLPVTEQEIINGGQEIIITLTGNEWAADLDSSLNMAKCRTLIGGFTATSDPNEWDKVKTPFNAEALAAPGDVERTSATVLTIRLPKPADYNILSNQTVRINIAPSLLKDSSNPVTNTLTFEITADREARLAGTITSTTTETNIVSGGKNIVINLTNETWEPSIITQTSLRDDLFELFIADVFVDGEDDEWLKVINALKAVPDPTTVMSLSNSNATLTITLPAVPGYNISGDQTIKLPVITEDLLVGPDDLNTSISFTIKTATTTATLGGTVTVPPTTESNIVAGIEDITITLADNTWAIDVVSSAAKREALIDAFTASTETVEWNKVKTALKNDGGSVVRTDDNVLTINLPPVAEYSITADQTVNINIPPTLLANYYLFTSPLSFTITADNAAAITGTITSAATEADIVAGGRTIIITLTNDTWVTDIATNIDRREELINGFTAVGAVADVDKWDDGTDGTTDVKDVMKARASVTRNSDKVVTITMPPVKGFNITGDLDVTLTVPASVVNISDDPLDAGKFTIAPVTTQSAVLSGTATVGITEYDIVTGGKTITITLTDDYWVENVASDDTQREDLIDGFKFDNPEAGSDEEKWNNMLENTLKNEPDAVVRTSDKVVTITLPAVPAADFDIAGDINVTLKIPQAVLTTASEDITVSAGFTISPVTAVLSGTAITAPPDSAAIAAGGKTIIITLNGATWVSDVASNTAKRNFLIEGFVADDLVVDDVEWDKVREAIKADSKSVKRTSNTVVTIKLPKVPNFSANEDGMTVTLTIPQTLVDGTNEPLDATPSVNIGAVVAATAELTGTTDFTEAEINAGTVTITVSLTDATWADDVISNATKRNALINGFTATTGAAEWTKVKTALKAAPLANFALAPGNQVLTITLPPVPDYDIIANQTVRLTVPKTVLNQSGYDITATGNITISIPVYTSRGTLEGMLADGSLSTYIETVPLQQIIVVVPKKYIKSIVTNQTTLGASNVTTVDVLAESDVASVKATAGGVERTVTYSEASGDRKKFTLGFTGLVTGSDIVISALDAAGNALQSDITKKIANGKKTYTEAPDTSLSGSYTLYKLMTTSSLLKSILKYYPLADLTVTTP